MVFIVLENNLEEYLKLLMCKDYSNKLIITYFTATWCGPCKMVSPIIQRIGEEKDSIVVIKVDVDECSEISENCEVDCMPTFLFNKNNNIDPVHRFSGADIDLLVQNINNYLQEE
jgi:thioredoxin 1